MMKMGTEALLVPIVHESLRCVGAFLVMSNVQDKLWGVAQSFTCKEVDV